MKIRTQLVLNEKILFFIHRTINWRSQNSTLEHTMFTHKIMHQYYFFGGRGGWKMLFDMIRQYRFACIRVKISPFGTHKSFTIKPCVK